MGKEKKEICNGSYDDKSWQGIYGGIVHFFPSSSEGQALNGHMFECDRTLEGLFSTCALNVVNHRLFYNVRTKGCLRFIAQ